MKKIFPFILLTIILIVGCIFIFTDNNNLSNNNISNNQKLELENIKEDQLDNSNEDSINEEVLTNDNSVKEDEKIEINKKDDVSTNNSNNTSINNSSSKKEEVIIEKNNNSNNEKIPSTNNEETKEDTTTSDNSNLTIYEFEIKDEPIDAEYERLKSLIKYKTGIECHNASIEVSLDYLDNPNFKHTACESFAYKGQLVGYRMLVYYIDGTTEYLDAIGQ